MSTDNLFLGFLLFMATALVVVTTLTFIARPTNSEHCIVNITKDHIHIKGNNCNYTINRQQP